MQLQTGYKQGGKTGSYAAADRIKEGGKTGSYTAVDRVQSGRKDRELCSCRQDTSREERQKARQLETGYREGGKTGRYAAADRMRGRKGRKLYSCRQDTDMRKERYLCRSRQDTCKEERQGAMQPQTGYKEGGKTESYAAADKIQA